MKGFFGLVRRQVIDSRWMLGISVLGLFAFGWLGAWVAARGERLFRRAISEEGMEQRRQILRSMSGDTSPEISITVFELQFWLHPFVWLPVVVWAISRGSLAIAGEIERGTLDLILSRPTSRSRYLLSQVAVAVLGLVLMAAALLAGHEIGTRLNRPEAGATFALFVRPTLNLAGLGFAIFGVTMLVSSPDRVRWRSMLIVSGLTVASLATWIVGGLPVITDERLKTILRRTSIFTAYNPMTAVSDIAVWRTHALVLLAIGLVGTIASFIIFARRDLPTSG